MQATYMRVKDFQERRTSLQKNTVKCDSLCGFPGGVGVKIPPVNAGDTEDSNSIPGFGRSPGGRNGNPFHYSCLGKPMDREAWQATVHGVAKRHNLATKEQHDSL